MNSGSCSQMSSSRKWPIVRRIAHNKSSSTNRLFLPPPPPPAKKNYKQKHCFRFLLDYCDTQNTSDLVLKQCLHTPWDPLLLHHYVSPKHLAPFRTLPQLFSTVSQPMSEKFKTVIWTHCHCYKGPRFDSISMTHRHFYFNFIFMSQTKICYIWSIFFF